jgi:3-oxoacyl-[acyl-carrier-protein] synthase-1
MTPLYVAGLGMVTAAGLNLEQSAASFIGGISGFAEAAALDVFPEMQITASVPAAWRLRPNTGEWLLNLAARAGAEAMRDAGVPPAQTVLICSPPESWRDHPCWADVSVDTFFTGLEERLGGDFAAGSRLVDGGPAALIGCLTDMAQFLGNRKATHFLLIGVDSLLNKADMARLRSAERLQGQSAQGVVPGEGAAAVVLTSDPVPGMAIRGIGLAEEADPVGGARQSQGRGMVNALERACVPLTRPESAVEFAVSNFNGERYGALEMLLYRARFYRTHRDYMATAYPAMSFGETGAAGGAIALAVAADAFRQGYAPGEHALLELVSDNGMRVGAYVSRCSEVD